MIPPDATPPDATPPDAPLPHGFTVELDPRVRRRDGGATLLGGSPLRLLRLSPGPATCCLAPG